jgi:hypothetical protein
MMRVDNKSDEAVFTYLHSIGLREETTPGYLQTARAHVYKFPNSAIAFARLVQAEMSAGNYLEALQAVIKLLQFDLSSERAAYLVVKQTLRYMRFSEIKLESLRADEIACLFTELAIIYRAETLETSTADWAAQQLISLGANAFPLLIETETITKQGLQSFAESIGIELGNETDNKTVINKIWNELG